MKRVYVLVSFVCMYVVSPAIAYAKLCSHASYASTHLITIQKNLDTLAQILVSTIQETLLLSDTMLQQISTTKYTHQSQVTMIDTMNEKLQGSLIFVDQLAEQVRTNNKRLHELSILMDTYLGKEKQVMEKWEATTKFLCM